MSDRARIAVVGLGTWAATGHLPVYRGRALADVVDVVALCSRDLGRARDWADRHDVEHAYDDLERLLDDVRPDLVAVCTPDHHHTDPVIRALDAGCDVIVEKPMTTDLDDARRVVEAAARSGRDVVTLLHKRADPLWAQAADDVRSGVLGPLQMGTFWMQNPMTVPAGGYFASETSAASDANWFLGSHAYDLVRFVTGLDPVSVRATRYEGALTARGLTAPDAYKAELALDGGASVSVLTSWNLPEHGPTLTQQQLRLHLRDGELDLDGTRRGSVRHSTDGYAFVNPYFIRDTPHGPAGYGAELLEAAVRSIVLDEEPLVSVPSLADAWWTTAVAQAVERAAATGAEVAVEPPPRELP